MGYYAIRKEDGTLFPLTATNNLLVKSASGASFPPVENQVASYGLADGGMYQHTRIKPRVLTLRVAILAGDPDMRDAAYAALVAILHPHRTLPIELCYVGRAKTLSLWCYYDSGLEGGSVQPGVAEFLLRFVAPDPYFYELADTSGALAVRDALANCNAIALRSATGLWGNANQGVGGVASWVSALLYDANNTLYAAGYFPTIGGVAAPNIAKWDGATWAALGAGLDTAGSALAIGADGTLYVGGVFHNAGGVGAMHVAKWSGGAWSALGAGTDDNVFSLICGPDGCLYAGGTFLNAGGAAAARIAKWNGASWSALGLGLDGGASAMAFGPDGCLYVGGAFVNAGGIAAHGIAKWNGSSWSALGSGVSGGTSSVSALAFGPDGCLYIGGEFTSAGGVAASNVAKWNGSSWSALGSGVSGSVSALGFDKNGVLHILGGFDHTGYYVIASAHCIWANPLWVGEDININTGGGSFARAISFGSDNRMAIGGQWVAADVNAIAGRTAVTNIGSARAYPVITLTGPGRLYQIINRTTGQRIDFNLLLLTGETLTIDLRPGHKAVVSSFRGNLQGTVLSGDLATMYLAPGENYLTAFLDNALAGGAYAFRPAHWGVDGAAA